MVSHEGHETDHLDAIAHAERHVEKKQAIVEKWKYISFFRTSSGATARQR
jgi:hypothetical protein